MNSPSGSVRTHAAVSTTAFASLLLLMVFVLAGSRTVAQSIQGSFIGTVTDKAGGVVPAATVTLTNLDEGSSRTADSSSTGEYQFIDAKAGRYSVEVSAAGFER